MPLPGLSADMAEPNDKINLANPPEVARETLRRLALRRIAPTPDNYQTLYEEIVGGPSAQSAIPSNAATAASALSGLVMDLNLHHPELAAPVETLNQAIRQNDWTQCRKQLGQITLQLKQQGESSGGGGENLALLRDLLAKTLEFGVVTQLSHSPRLAEKAQHLAAAVRDANSASALRSVTSGLKSLWVGIEMQAPDLQNQSLQEAEKRLKEVIYKQSMVKHGLREATATLKATMTTFVSRMRDAVAASDEYQGKIAARIERIRNTADVLELNRILENLLDETRSAQADTRRAHEQLIGERDAAVQAESRIKQLETELAQMSALVREDPMTRSLNRRGLDDEFAREASRADRYDTPFSIAVLDVDNFKALNDKRGHQTGDEALIHLVKVAKEELRITDHIARMGGEEFLIILPNTPLDEAARIITRLQRSLTKKYFLDNNEKVLITFSAGVAQRLPGESQEASIARADSAMYLAKHSGKNRVCLASDAPVKAGE